MINAHKNVGLKFKKCIRTIRQPCSFSRLFSGAILNIGEFSASPVRLRLYLDESDRVLSPIASIVCFSIFAPFTHRISHALDTYAHSTRILPYTTVRMAEQGEAVVVSPFQKGEASHLKFSRISSFMSSNFRHFLCDCVILLLIVGVVYAGIGHTVIRLQ